MPSLESLTGLRVGMALLPGVGYDCWTALAPPHTSRSNHARRSEDSGRRTRSWGRHWVRLARTGVGRAERIAEFLGDAFSAEPRAGAAMKRGVAVGAIGPGADDDDSGERQGCG